ncbi:hypothetical protein [Colwellia sp. Bg11-28]|uniref:hypothetical protein n=1 Tax=Colwellia sp. Bg11-28 TaxID=2058305 RepID=UPI000C3273AD|nr:hypothetical protein [Colwellia sp. Bg11-28]PKH87484.1 hypothetical protein CXF79_12595 [Colwellia sp. Bg11-28]
MKYLILLSILVLSACTTTPEVTSNLASTDVMKLIEKTAANAPNAIKGTFQVSIKASEAIRRVVYLNTELDYRDRRSITIELHPKTIAVFTKKYGLQPDEYFINKNIEITGEAEQVKIWFFSNGKRTNKYYFQTHIKVKSINQIKVLS